MSRLEGRCLCGAVRLRVDEPQAEVRACHCGMCRRWTGAAFFALTAEPDRVAVEGPVRVYRSSSFAERAFCEHCGSHLWMRDDGAAYELMPGLFEAAKDFPLVSEIYIDHRLAAIRLEGKHRRRTRAEYESRNPFVAEERLP